jgi:hypothetical protein
LIHINVSERDLRFNLNRNIFAVISNTMRNKTAKNYDNWLGLASSESSNGRGIFFSFLVWRKYFLMSCRSSIDDLQCQTLFFSSSRNE